MGSLSKTDDANKGDRRVVDRREVDMTYDGPERRKHVRRSGEDRRQKPRSV